MEKVRAFVIIKSLVLLLPLIVVVNAKCKDTSSYCKTWSKANYCTVGASVGYMKTNCKKSCGLCPPAPAPANPADPGCKDTLKDCNFWQSIGECTRNPKYMLESCKRSCGKCGGGGGGSRIRNVAKWAKWGAWNSCSKFCGRGERRRSRNCVLPAGAPQGCRGNSKEVEYCNSQPCPPVPGPDTGPPSTFTLSTTRCGMRKSKSGFGTSRIVGGENAAEGKWPWQVGLFYGANMGFNTKYPFCGGTLIRSNVVLTAAHCFPYGAKTGARNKVRVGDFDLLVKGTQEKTVSVRKVVIHKDYVKDTYLNDIAVMILEEDVTLGDKVNTACLPSDNDLVRDCFVTGWGRLTEGGRQPRLLQDALVPLVHHALCNKAYKGKIQPGMMCAGYKAGGIDACQGDSGGPLVCDRGDGRYVLSGITSWGKGCATKGFYGVYTDTRKFMKWIRKAVNS